MLQGSLKGFAVHFPWLSHTDADIGTPGKVKDTWCMTPGSNLWYLMCSLYTTASDSWRCFSPQTSQRILPSLRFGGIRILPKLCHEVHTPTLDQTHFWPRSFFLEQLPDLSWQSQPLKNKVFSWVFKPKKQTSKVFHGLLKNGTGKIQFIFNAPPTIGRMVGSL